MSATSFISIKIRIVRETLLALSASLHKATPLRVGAIPATGLSDANMGKISRSLGIWLWLH
ncbi:MAG: hypothetical protein WA667_00960 [Candidatus Nitrosopolaris sp.]